MSDIVERLREGHGADWQTAEEAAAKIERLRAAASDLIGIVDGVYGAMTHGTWRDAHERRLNDTPEWVAFHNAALEEKT